MRYSEAFEVWWADNKHSESLQDDYRSYRLNVSYTDEKPMSFKRWGYYQYKED